MFSNLHVKSVIICSLNLVQSVICPVYPPKNIFHKGSMVNKSIQGLFAYAYNWDSDEPVFMQSQCTVELARSHRNDHYHYGNAIKGIFAFAYSGDLEEPVYMHSQCTVYLTFCRKMTTRNNPKSSASYITQKCLQWRHIQYTKF